MIPDSVSLHGTAPVSAYAHMVNLLDPDHLKRRPPAAGVELIVAGFDGVWSWWLLTYEEAVRLRPRILAHMGLRLVSATPYLDTDTTTTTGDDTP